MSDQEGPQIALRQIGATRTGGAEYWTIGWEVESRGEQPVKILSAHLPHGRFKSEKVFIEPPVDLPPGERKKFHVSVRCDEPSGLVTENAFVIFHVIWSDADWRIFARVRVVVNDDGTPTARVESITTQKIGFSGVRF